MRTIEYKDEQEEYLVMPDIETPMNSGGRPMFQHLDHDKIMNAEVKFELNESLYLGKVKVRSVGPDGKVYVNHNDNTIMSTIRCDVEFPDRKVREHSANIMSDFFKIQIR